MGCNTYCLCMSIDSAVITLGMLQLNAALFFWARFSVFNPYYWYFDVVLGVIYTVRFVYFLEMYIGDSKATRQSYYQAHYYSSFVILAVAIAIITMKTLQWGHFPLLEFGCWFLWSGIASYSTWLLYEYVPLATSRRLRNSKIDDTISFSTIQMEDAKKNSKMVVLNHDMY